MSAPPTISLHWIANCIKSRVEPLYRHYPDGYLAEPRPTFNKSAKELKEKGFVGFYAPTTAIPEGFLIKPRQTLKPSPGGGYEAELEPLEQARKRASLALDKTIKR